VPDPLDTQLAEIEARLDEARLVMEKGTKDYPIEVVQMALRDIPILKRERSLLAALRTSREALARALWQIDHPDDDVDLWDADGLLFDVYDDYFARAALSPPEQKEKP
jgi:hypothetical protein